MRTAAQIANPYYAALPGLCFQESSGPGWAYDGFLCFFHTSCLQEVALALFSMAAEPYLHAGLQVCVAVP